MMITQELIKIARQTNLVDYLIYKGVNLKSVGNGNYQHPEHDSLYIKQNHFKWYSQGMIGNNDSQNAITLVMELFGLDFKTAVNELVAFSTVNFEKPVYERLNASQGHSNLNTNCKRALGYLCKKRGIDYKIVCDFINLGVIRQDNNGNIAFKRPNGSAELHGTGDARFKGQLGQQEDFGVEFLNGNNVKYVIYVESGIDLLSFYQLKLDKLNDCMLISLGGLKINVVKHYYHTYPNAIHVFAGDNDAAADEFYNDLCIYMNIRRIVPSYKDWNDELVPMEVFGVKYKEISGNILFSGTLEECYKFIDDLNDELYENGFKENGSKYLWDEFRELNICDENGNIKKRIIG